MIPSSEVGERNFYQYNGILSNIQGMRTAVDCEEAIDRTGFG